MLVYVEAIKQLQTVPSYFENKPGVSTVQLSVAEGALIGEGDTIGTINYVNGDQEDMVVPAGCNGVVVSLNTAIVTTALDSASEEIMTLEDAPA